MNHLYLKINQIAKKYIYEHMKLNGISSQNYKYHSFFSKSLIKHNITCFPQVLGQGISGLSIKSPAGNTITYDINHHIHRQNFTKCHELGHFLLNHNGQIFTENGEQSINEIEANYFASAVLMPDIVLLRKIVYDQKTFQEIYNDLEVSPQALEIRLSHLLQYISNLPKHLISSLIRNYKAHIDYKIADTIDKYKDKIINDFINVKPDPLKMFSKLWEKHCFISNYNLPEISYKQFRHQLKQTYPSLRSWSYWDQNETIIYVWDIKRTNWENAQKQAINEHFKKVHCLY